MVTWLPKCASLHTPPYEARLWVKNEFDKFNKANGSLREECSTFATCSFWFTAAFTNSLLLCLALVGGIL